MEQSLTEKCFISTLSLSCCMFYSVKSLEIHSSVYRGTMTKTASLLQYFWKRFNRCSQSILIDVLFWFSFVLRFFWLLSFLPYIFLSHSISLSEWTMMDGWATVVTAMMKRKKVKFCFFYTHSRIMTLARTSLIYKSLVFKRISLTLSKTIVRLL